jgi:hypothetical protein
LIQRNDYAAIEANPELDRGKTPEVVNLYRAARRANEHLGERLHTVGGDSGIPSCSASKECQRRDMFVIESLVRGIECPNPIPTRCNRPTDFGAEATHWAAVEA